MVDSAGGAHTSLVMSKTKVCPIKRLSIPRLELCGAQVLARLLHHTKEIFHVPLSGLDRQHHCFELVDREPSEVQDLRGKPSL